MPAATASVLYGMGLPSLALLAQLREHTNSMGIEDLIEYTAGHFEPLFVGSASHKPEISFDSTDLSGVLTATGWNGASQAAGNVDLYYKKVTDLGTREADASLVHDRYRVAQSYLYWQSISASQGNPATISTRLAITYDGVNAPIVAAGSVALAGTVATANSFTLGPVKINGVFLNGVTDVRIEKNITPIELDADGEPFNTFFAIGQGQPVLTITTRESPSIANAVPQGVALTAIKFWFRRSHEMNGLNYADGAAQHVSFTGTVGRVHAEQTSGGGNEPVATVLRCPLKAPLVTTAPLAIALTDTIA